MDFFLTSIQVAMNKALLFYIASINLMIRSIYQKTNDTIIVKILTHVMMPFFVGMDDKMNTVSQTVQHKGAKHLSYQYEFTGKILQFINPYIL